MADSHGDGGFESNGGQRARDCQAAAELVVQALVLCERAGVELAVILLGDVSSVLADGPGDPPE